MPIANIIDNRTNKYHWKFIDAIVEPIWQDNSVKGSDIFDEEISGEILKTVSSYNENVSVSLEQAVNWAQNFKYPVTLYLYDVGTATEPLSKSKRGVYTPHKIR